ncbi:MAG: response regulator [Bryobacteraceae bacterium]
MQKTLPSRTGGGVSILLVDDNSHGLVARRTILEELGHRVITACSGDEALHRFSSQSFDLVITDYRMPKMDGMQLIKRLRALRPALPIIMVSGFVEPLGLSEATTGADAVIGKTANEVSQLIRAVTRLVNRRKPPASNRSSARAKSKGGAA